MQLLSGIAFALITAVLSSAFSLMSKDTQDLIHKGI